MILKEGDIHAQEEMLKNKSKMINAGASRNIFKLVWGDAGPSRQKSRPCTKL